VTKASQALPSGGCRCGKVRFSASAEPHFAAICHCEDCRKASGAPFLAFVGFHRSEVRFEHGEGRRYETEHAARFFCETCGSPIAYADGRLVDRIYFYLGVMDEPARYEPTHQAFISERLPFACLKVDLPGHDKLSVPRL